jgi:carbonic anhydrase
MHPLDTLFDNNRRWADKMRQRDGDVFSRLAAGQSPKYLWIGCADSRVPASQVLGLGPGELFVHRNIANVVLDTDLNCLATIQYAVEALKVEHVIVCGHYGCGGVRAALGDDRIGLIDNWLRPIQAIRVKHADEIDALGSEAERHRRLCELNVIEQAANAARTTVIRSAFERGQRLTVHGLIYELETGRLRDLDTHIGCGDSKKIFHG